MAGPLLIFAAAYSYRRSKISLRKNSFPSFFFPRRTKLFGEFLEKWNPFERKKKKKILARFDSTFNIGFFSFGWKHENLHNVRNVLLRNKGRLLFCNVGYEVTAEPIQFQERALFDVLNITGSGICRLFRNVF